MSPSHHLSVSVTRGNRTRDVVAEFAPLLVLGLIAALAYFMFLAPTNASAAGIFDANHWNSIFNDWKSAAVSALGAILFVLAVVVFIRTKSAAALFGFLVMGALAIIFGQAIVNNQSDIEKSVKTDVISR